MQSEYVYPALGDRTSPREWEEQGGPDLLQKAAACKAHILARPPAAKFDLALERKIRSAFRIHIAPG